ncbi:MAG: TIGR04157 family glycosyltransferase [Tannerella sp.]|jgi:glycosyltransferase|nr:TIGR04157 family glycosyltransferase [Tannerella sp.]
MFNLYLFNESSRASVYGIGTYIRALSAALKNSAVNVCVVYLRSDKPQMETEETDGFKQWYIPAPGIPDRGTGQQANESYYRNVVYLLQLHITDRENLIFHLNYWQGRPLVNELKRAFTCRVLFTIHYTGWGFSLSGNLSRLADILSRPEEQRDGFENSVAKDIEREKEMCLSVDRIAVLSHHMRAALDKFYHVTGDNISLVPNGLSDSPDTSTCDRESLRRNLLIPVHEKIIIFAGRLDDIKGVTFLIRAFRRITEQLPDCRMIIAGNGNFDGYMKEAGNACSRIIFTGMVDRSRLYELYRLSDVGAVPSLYEPFGYVATEMMMHGLPVVAAATSGLNEIVEDGVNGLKVPVIEHPDRVEIDPDLLAEKLLYMLQHPESAKQWGENARKRYLEKYSSEVFRDNMLSLYGSLYQQNNNLQKNKT